MENPDPAPLTPSIEPVPDPLQVAALQLQTAQIEAQKAETVSKAIDKICAFINTMTEHFTSHDGSKFKLVISAIFIITIAGMALFAWKGNPEDAYHIAITGMTGIIGMLAGKKE